MSFSMLYFSKAWDAQSTASCCMSSDMSAFLITAFRSAIVFFRTKKKELVFAYGLMNQSALSSLPQPHLSPPESEGMSLDQTVRCLVFKPQLVPNIYKHTKRVNYYYFHGGEREVA